MTVAYGGGYALHPWRNLKIMALRKAGKRALEAEERAVVHDATRDGVLHLRLHQCLDSGSGVINQEDLRGQTVQVAEDGVVRVESGIGRHENARRRRRVVVVYQTEQWVSLGLPASQSTCLPVGMRVISSAVFGTRLSAFMRKRETPRARL